MTGLQLFQAHVQSARAQARISRSYRAGAAIRLQVSGQTVRGSWEHLAWFEVVASTKAELRAFTKQVLASYWPQHRAFLWTMHLTHHNCADFGAITRDVSDAMHKIMYD